MHIFRIKTPFYIKHFIILLLLLQGGQQANAQLKHTDREHLIEAFGSALVEGYIHAGPARQMSTYISEQLKAGSYDTLADPEVFVRRVSEDMRSISKDLHLSVFYSPTVLPEYNGFRTQISGEEKERMQTELAKDNYGLEKAEVLAGNIGYLDFRYFAPLEFSGDTYAGAFRQLEDVDALILDLRNNHGSMSDQVIPFLCGYLFSSSVHLNSIYFKQKEFTQQYWSSEYVPSKKLSEVPVYVLISGKTFSGGEELAYDLQALKRATLVGHNTAGGANPVAPVKVNAHYGINLPQALVINPVTKTNWEGVGVQADTIVLPALALETAHRLALKKLISENAVTERANLVNLLENMEASAMPLQAYTFTLEGYPTASEVYLSACFNNWAMKANAMVREKEAWSVSLLLPRGIHEYKFIVDGRWITDPGNLQAGDTAGTSNSILRL